MENQKKTIQSSASGAQELCCKECGGTFIFRRCERERFGNYGWTAPKRCPDCRRAAQERKREAEKRREDAEWQEKKAEEKKNFESRLKEWNVVSKDDIHPESDRVLYIIGNGFDLMHGVRSSYYAFRDTLGKQNPLRTSLEQFWTPEDIWADFEAGLAHFNAKAMCSKFMVHEWLDICEVYDEDAGMTEFFMAVEGAANPILTVVNELQRRFRMWVESLAIGTEDRPLRGMFRNGKVLCFNYTEFVETLYDISEDNVCYIHGCRRKKKYRPKDKLILGHMPGESEDSYDFSDDSYVGTRDPRKLQMIEAAQEYVFRLVAESDDALTKNCGDIIAAHKSFFSELNEIEDVIVIGHSLSPVDWDYFAEVASKLPNGKACHWYFGCHGCRDLDNLEQLMDKLKLDPDTVSVFRTDNIVTTPLKEEVACKVHTGPVEKTRDVSAGGQWEVRSVGGSLSVIERKTWKADYETMFSSYVDNAFFAPSGKHMFVVIRGMDSGVLLLRMEDGHWRLVDELESMQHQSLLNPRLNQVYLTDKKVTFVYNSRVREYSLEDGKLISNRALRNAGSFVYDGMAIGHLFQRRKRGFKP